MHARLKRVRKIAMRVMGIGLLLGAVLIAISSFLIHRAARGRLYESVEDIPKRKVGLVFGCSKWLAGGRRNMFFAHRMQAAAELYRSGKVEYLLVSGDNRVASYNEPSDMQEELVAFGIPMNAIYCDYAGLRTLDSVVRAKKVFGEDSIIVISQRFQNERAIFIAKSHDIDAIGFNAPKVDKFNGFLTKVREQLAKVMTVIDVSFLHTEPRFLGPKIVIGEPARGEQGST